MPDKAKESKIKLSGEGKPSALLPFNPLMDSAIITPEAENEQKVEIIERIESLTTLNKQELMVKKERIALEVDSKKLDTAKKTITAISDIIDAVGSPEILQRVVSNIKTPMDMKFMAEAVDKLTSSLKNMMNQVTTDETGGRKRTKILAQFQTQSGEKAAIAVEMGGND